MSPDRTDMPGPRHARYDVIVIGARCAGAATAMLLARQGAHVLVIDRQPYGSDALSTHALMRPAVQRLAGWGVLDAVVAAGTPPITSTSFHYGKAATEIPIRTEPGIAGLYAPRRFLLDRLLVDAASGAGAEVVHGLAVRDLLMEDGRVSGIVAGGHLAPVCIRAGLIVGADGVGSFLARRVGAETLKSGATGLATVYRYGMLARNIGYHWLYAAGVGAGVIPTNDGMACVFVSAPLPVFDVWGRGDPVGWHCALFADIAPDLCADLAFSPGQDVRVFRGRPGWIRQAHGPGWALVGDAGFFRDPITAHGIADAFRDAEALATAVAEGGELTMARYQSGRDAFAVPLLETTDAIARLDGDFEALERHHRTLSRIMKAETAALTVPPVSPESEGALT